MAVCDFDVAIEIHDGTTATILGDLNDQTLGLSVGVPMDEDDDQWREITTDSPFVAGDFLVQGTPGVGRLEVVLLVTGTTWTGLRDTYRTAREWWRQAGSFHLDVTIEGDTTRYLARRPNVTAERMETGNIVALDRSYILSFPVQPNPVVI